MPSLARTYPSPIEVLAEVGGLPADKMVGFPPSPVTGISRPLSREERWAMYHFEMHARECGHCADPYRVHKAGRQLCADGHRLAHAVAAYLFRRDGFVYSSTETDSVKLVRVEIPDHYDNVGGLLKALERSLRRHQRRHERQRERQLGQPHVHYEQHEPAAHGPVKARTLDRSYAVTERIPDRTKRPAVPSLPAAILTPSRSTTTRARPTSDRPAHYDTVVEQPGRKTASRYSMLGALPVQRHQQERHERHSRHGEKRYHLHRELDDAAIPAGGPVADLAAPSCGRSLHYPADRADRRRDEKEYLLEVREPSWRPSKGSRRSFGYFG